MASAAGVLLLGAVVAGAFALTDNPTAAPTAATTATATRSSAPSRPVPRATARGGSRPAVARPSRSPSPSAGATDSTPPADPQPGSDGGPGTRDAAVAVTFYGWSTPTSAAEVGGYVDGVTESGGTCTVTLSQNGRTVSAQRSAVPDASTTSCGSIAIPASRLSQGSWQAVLSYSSAKFAGAAPAVTIEVP